jgi:hypothetical protein
MANTAYNLDAIKNKINSLTSNNKGAEKAKINWAKFQIGTYDVRFVPLMDVNGNPLAQPFYEVSYYDNKDLSERRFVAPSQFGQEDPIKETAMELAKDKSREAWLVRKKLTPRERYYAAIVIRGEEEKGLQVWELSPKLCKDIYGILVHPDYADEDMFSPESGYDFTVTVSATDKTFNNFPVKEIKLQPRRKSNKLLPKKEQVEALLKTVPNFEAYFRAQIKSPEELVEIRDNFLTVQSADAGADQVTADGTTRGQSEESAKAVASVDAAFSDLDS